MIPRYAKNNDENSINAIAKTLRKTAMTKAAGRASIPEESDGSIRARKATAEYKQEGIGRGQPPEQINAGSRDIAKRRAARNQ